MFTEIISRSKKHLINIRGWRTNRKIIVIESDDWGAIRMPSAEVVEKLKNYGLNVEKCHYMKNDALASEEDLENLLNVLIDIVSENGQHPILTANTIVANPDFKKIWETNYEYYFYELFTDTLKKYPQHENSFKYWIEGMDKKLFYPQFHGREHLQVSRWMKDLKLPNRELQFAFRNNFYGISNSVSQHKRKSYQAAYDIENENDLDFIQEAITDGLSIFESVFGYRSKSTIAPNFVWDADIEKILSHCGVLYLQGGRVQRFPARRVNKRKYVRRFTGQSNEFNQIYLIRNCSFEPSSNESIDWVGSCMSEINTAFMWGKPAIIDSHRVNYIGFINTDNRERSLKLLKKLLTNIVKKWPDVEFMTSDQLGNVITENGQ